MESVLMLNLDTSLSVSTVSFLESINGHPNIIVQKEQLLYEFAATVY